jgi:hypothetical protein
MKGNMSKTTLIVISLGVILTLRAAGVSEVPFSRVTREVPAFSPGGPIQVQAGETLVSVSLDDATPTKGDFVVLFDPATHRFLWQNFTRSPRGGFKLMSLDAFSYDKHQALVSLDQSISWWRSGSGAIEIRSSSETAKSLDDAFDKALSELKIGWETRYSKADYPIRTVAFRDKDEMRDFVFDPARPSAMTWLAFDNMARRSYDWG